jgi:hypothetical protein
LVRCLHCKPRLSTPAIVQPRMPCAAFIDYFVRGRG